MADGQLIDELKRYEDEYTSAREDVKQLTGGVSEEQFNWRPAEERWSMAECLDHLCMIGSYMIPKIDEATRIANEKGWRSDGPFEYGFIGNWFVRAVSGGDGAPKRRFRAPAMYTPKSEHSISRVETAFMSLQDDFIECLHKANGLDLKRVKLASPVTRLLRFSLGQWFALLAGHQRRHFWQAGEVREEMENRNA